MSAPSMAAMAFATLVACALPSRPAHGQQAGCLVHPDTAGPLVEQVKLMILAGRDSVRLARAGLLPVDTSEVALVTDSRLCAPAIAAYNRQKPSAVLETAYVIRAGASRFLVWDMRDPELELRDIMVFDCGWGLTAWFVG